MVYDDQCGFLKGGNGQEIEMVVINPQSVTLPQLYGHQDELTSEWVDGILSAHYRKFARSENTNRLINFFELKIIFFAGSVLENCVAGLRAHKGE